MMYFVAALVGPPFLFLKLQVTHSDYVRSLSQLNVMIGFEMKSVNAIFSSIVKDKELESLSKLCREIVSWQETSILTDGELRKFAARLDEEGYPSHNCLDIARSTVLQKAAAYVAALCCDN